jgi:hypothetical protein
MRTLRARLGEARVVKRVALDRATNDQERGKPRP